MRFLIWIIFLSAPVLAANTGIISKDGQTIDIIDTYTIFDTESNEVTIHLLSCKYSDKLRLDWQAEYGFLKCFPISNEKYLSAPGASLSIRLDDKGKIKTVIFSTTQVGDKKGRDYQGFSKSWFRNAPIDGWDIKNEDHIKFSLDFEIPDKALKVSLNINTVVNETIKSTFGNGIKSKPGEQ